MASMRINRSRAPRRSARWWTASAASRRSPVRWAMRDYRRRLDVDPAELRRVDERLSAIHDAARKHRVRPDALPGLLSETQARLAALAEAADAEVLARRAADTESAYRAVAKDLTG